MTKLPLLSKLPLVACMRRPPDPDPMVKGVVHVTVECPSSWQHCETSVQDSGDTHGGGGGGGGSIGELWHVLSVLKLP